MAWENVCMDKEDGGLGIKRTDTRNACLLLKMIHRLHHPDGSAWASWAREMVDISTLQGDLQGTHWAALRDLLPAYRQITTVTTGDGRCTSFWYDRWATDTPLADMFLALHSHFVSRGESVHDVVGSDLRPQFQPRLSARAAAELEQLADIIQGTELTASPDERSSFFEDGGHRLLSGLIYKASVRGDHQNAGYDFVWRNFAPPRVKFFAWLLTQNRINSRSSLIKKNIVEDSCCELCGAAEEKADHIISECSFVCSFWAAIGWNPSAISKVNELWTSTPLPSVHKDVLHPLLLLLSWEIWKHCNEVIFRGLAPDIGRLKHACQEAIKDWSCRIPRKKTVLARH